MSLLAAGIICAASSPLGAGFFFVAKKDQSLCPCIDLGGLSNISKEQIPIYTYRFDF